MAPRALVIREEERERAFAPCILFFFRACGLFKLDSAGRLAMLVYLSRSLQRGFIGAQDNDATCNQDYLTKKQLFPDLPSGKFQRQPSISGTG